MSDPITGEVDIINNALLKLGQEPVVAPSDSPDMNLRYAGARDAVLRLHPWSCAMHTNTALTKITGTGPGGFTNMFALPTDFIRLKNMQNLAYEYRIFGSPDGGKIFATNEATAEIDYIFRLENVLDMDELLKEAIAAKLAADCCIKLTQDMKLKRELTAEVREHIALAEAADMQEQPRTDTVTPTGWRDAHYHGVMQHDSERTKIEGV